MTAALEDIVQVALIGIGATALMDAWLALLGRLGVRTSSFALVGRWAGHLLRGTFAHADIARAAPVAGERAWGWLVHYATGVAFAAVLVAVQGLDWASEPTLGPALVTGIVTVLAPLLVLQPAMGAGVFATRTPAPLANVTRSVANHAVFGVGLYVSALALVMLSRLA
jgi:hypothetical protein